MNQFSCFFFLFQLFVQKTLKKHISTSVRSAQHPKAGKNLQQWSPCCRFVSFLRESFARTYFDQCTGQNIQQWSPCCRFVSFLRESFARLRRRSIRRRFFLPKFVTATPQHLTISVTKNFRILHHHSVVCCCKLNNTRDCDERLFGQVSTLTGRYQLPIFHCTNVHPWRY